MKGSKKGPRPRASHSSARSRVPLPDTASVLLVTDVQNDFCPGGALGVPGGDDVIPRINAYIRFFQQAGASVIASRDWHPPGHCSFQGQGGPWPPHCIQGSWGSQFHQNLVLATGVGIVSKATDAGHEAYSAFEGTTLEERLRDLEADKLYVTGLATDYCVKNTVLDARRLGFQVIVLADAIRGIDVNPGDSARALEEMVDAGALLANASDLGLDNARA